MEIKKNSRGIIGKKARKRRGNENTTPPKNHTNRERSGTEHAAKEQGTPSFPIEEKKDTNLQVGPKRGLENTHKRVRG